MSVLDGLGTSIGAVGEGVRNGMAQALRSMLVDPSGPLPEDFAEPAGDPGLFGPGSAVWTVHGDPAMFVGGVRALLLQTLHPLAMAGVAEHSDYRSDPLGRLRRTAAFVAVTTYGSTAMVERACDAVRAIHTRVVGTAPDGRNYSAGDPDLLLWVHCAEVESFLIAHKRYGASSLTRAGVDEYVDSMAEVAVRLGATEVPRSWVELQDYFSDVRPELRARRQAREAVLWLLNPPLPLASRGPYAVITAAAIASLPGWAARMLWLPQPPLVDPLVLRPAVGTMLRTLGWILPESPVVEAATRRSAVPDGR